MKSVLKIKLFSILILPIFLTSVFFYLKSNSTDTIPDEKPEAKQKLEVIISKSKINTTEAIERLEELNDLPEYTEYKKNYVLARLYEKNQKTPEDLLLYKKIIDKNYPLKERVIFHYANLSAKNRDDNTALQYFNKLLWDFPNSKSVPQTKYYLAQTQLRLRFTKEALKNLKSLKNEFPETQFGIAANYYLGENEYNKKNYNEAIDLFREYLRLSPDGRFANEIAEMITHNEGISLKPIDFTLLGDVFFHKKDYKNAAGYFKKSRNTKKYYKLGYSLFRINNKNEAAFYFKEFAKKYPKSQDAKWSLFYAARCIPAFMQTQFWSSAKKDIPELVYYTTYKEALSITDKTKRKELLEKYIETFPSTKFTLDAVWEIIWGNIQSGNYLEAVSIGEKYFNESINSDFVNSETRAKIGFWLGKIAELKKDREKALKYYKEVSGLIFDSYYSFRAKHRINGLTSGKDPMWNQEKKYEDLKHYDWLIPPITKPEIIKKRYGATIYELINLKQYDEVFELIGKTKSPSKQITIWLQALNNEYEPSINLANKLGHLYNYSQKNTMWNFAYPLYFWQHIISTCEIHSTLDPFLICGVIRQESRFDKNALSVSNARGLMQLILPTAKTISRQLNTSLGSGELLFDPGINISLGIYYLDGLMEEFNNPLFAVAAYNAGPNAVKRWINSFSKKSTDLDYFIEEVPYEETKNYIKKVFSSYWT